jgi:hypothetical protein
VNSDHRSARHREAAQAAAVRVQEAHDRLAEIERRLRELRGPLPAPEYFGRAEYEAARAVARRAESSRRARQAQEASVAAHEAAARAHERAAHVHDRAAEAGVGDVENHRRLSARHRVEAAADRAAGRDA